MTDWGRRAEAQLNELATCTETGPGVTHFPFSPEHRAALDLLRQRMETADLTVNPGRCRHTDQPA